MISILRCIISCVSLSLGVVIAAADDGPKWVVYHAWDSDQQYTKRGVLEWSYEDETLIVKNDDGALSPESVQAMLDYGWYHVKVENANDSGENNDNYVMATVPACNLRKANFKDEFQIILPRTSESITSFAYNPLVSPLAPATCDEYSTLQESPTLSSRAQVVLDTPGMVLKNILPQNKPAPGLKFLPNPNRSKGKSGEGGAGGGGDPNEENKPPPSFINDFLMKYWYILLPLFIMNFMVPPEEDPQQSGGGAQPAGDGSVAAAPSSGGGGSAPSGGGAPAAAAGGGGQSKRAARRGKRS